MGRGRGKGRRQPSVAARDDTGSGEEEKLPVRRRGRPQKVLKDDFVEEDEIERTGDDEEGEDTKDLNKNNKNQLAATENGKKRKRPSQVKENVDLVKEENGKTNSNGVIKSVGYRPNGSRRKNKPRRAAEVGVECK